MKDIDMKVKVPKRHKKESPTRLLVNSMIVSVIVSLVIHALILLVLGHIRFAPFLTAEKVHHEEQKQETDWFFDIPPEQRPREESTAGNNHSRRPWQVQPPTEKLPEQIVKPEMTEAVAQIPENPIVDAKELQVSPEELDKAFKSIKLTGVEVDDKKKDAPEIESMTLPKMADMLPDTSLMLDIPDVPDAVLKAPEVKPDMSIVQPGGIAEANRGVNTVALPAETLGGGWSISGGDGDGLMSVGALKEVPLKGGVAFSTSLDKLKSVGGSGDGTGSGSGSGSVARQRAVTYGVKVQLGDGIKFDTPDDDNDDNGGIVFQPEISTDQKLIEDVRIKEGGEAIESSMPLEGYVDIHVKIMRDDEGGGYFQVLMQPNEKSAELNDVAKDVLFIIDHSGSIRENRLRQFKRMTLEAMSYLNPSDRFNVVSFASRAEGLFSGFVAPSKENVLKASKYVNRLMSTGTTDVFGGVGPFVKRGNGELTRPMIVFLMTDGQSTVSVHRSADTEVDNRKSNEVLKAIASSNPGNVSIYPFSAGKDSNRMLMDFMARLNGGMPYHAPNGDNFRGELSSFIRTHMSLIVRNFRYIVEGSLAENIYPKTLPHLYRNESLAIYGRFGAGDEELVLTLLGYDSQGNLRNVVFKRKFSECEEIERDSMEAGVVSLREQWTAQKALHLLAEWVNSYDPNKAKSPEMRARRLELNRLMGAINAFSKYSELLQ